VRLSLLAFAVSFLGCAAPCPSQPVSGADGGTAGCVRVTDCPAPSSVLLCTNDMDRLGGCIACENNACVQYAPTGACP
jgi:hypothetical protein